MEAKKKRYKMLTLNQIETQLKTLLIKIDFYYKMQVEAELLGIKDLIDFKTYL